MNLNVPAPNSSSNDTPFMIRKNYSGRSMCRLHRELIVSSSAAHCVATAHVVTDIPRQEQRGRRSAQSAIEFMINTFHVQDRSDFNECASASLISPAWSGITMWRGLRLCCACSSRHMAGYSMLALSSLQTTESRSFVPTCRDTSRATLAAMAGDTANLKVTA